MHATKIRRRLRTVPGRGGAALAAAALLAGVLGAGCGEPEPDDEPRPPPADTPAEREEPERAPGDTLPEGADTLPVDTLGERDADEEPADTLGEREADDEEQPSEPDEPAEEDAPPEQRDAAEEAPAEEAAPEEERPLLRLADVAVGAYERDFARLHVRWSQATPVAWSRVLVLEDGEVVAWRNVNLRSAAQRTIFRLPRRESAWRATLVLEAYREPGGYREWPPPQPRLARLEITRVVPPRGACSDYEGREMLCLARTRR